MASPARPLLFADPVFLEHQTGDHPESPERLRYLAGWLKDRPVSARYEPGQVRPATRAELERVHETRYLETLETFARGGGGRIEVDTVVSPRSFEVASRAAGTALAAVDAVVSAKAPRAVCLVRPPGHHALRGSAMGFCLLNNVALAAAHALAAHHLERVLIVDWDVHHGNGTQDIFYENGSVYFFSAHRFPFYPGTGKAEETGSGPGLGTNFNLPVRFGTPRERYLEKFQTTLEQAASRCRPELVLVSAGFDAHAADPIGSLQLETEDFASLTRLVVQAADQYCGGRIVSVLEGGYNVKALAESVECHLLALLPEAEEDRSGRP